MQQEKKADFYIELPISIKVIGGYHDFGAFVSGVAGLPRIVTLHDFVIVPTSDDNIKSAKDNDKVAKQDDQARNSEELAMVILAKTYRYKSSEDAEKDAEKDAKKEAGKAKKQPEKKAEAGSKKGKDGGK